MDTCASHTGNMFSAHPVLVLNMTPPTFEPNEPVDRGWGPHCRNTYRLKASAASRCPKHCSRRNNCSTGSSDRLPREVGWLCFTGGLEVSPCASFRKILGYLCSISWKSNWQICRIPALQEDFFLSIETQDSQVLMLSHYEVSSGGSNPHTQLVRGCNATLKHFRRPHGRIYPAVLVSAVAFLLCRCSWPVSARRHSPLKRT